MIGFILMAAGTISWFVWNTTEISLFMLIWAIYIETLFGNAQALKGMQEIYGKLSKKDK